MSCTDTAQHACRAGQEPVPALQTLAGDVEIGGRATVDGCRTQGTRLQAMKGVGADLDSTIRKLLGCHGGARGGHMWLWMEKGSKGTACETLSLWARVQIKVSGG